MPKPDELVVAYADVARIIRWFTIVDEEGLDTEEDRELIDELREWINSDAVQAAR